MKFFHHPFFDQENKCYCYLKRERGPNNNNIYEKKKEEEEDEEEAYFRISYIASFYQLKRILFTNN